MSNDIHIKQWDAIPHPYIDINIEATPWMIKYLPVFYVDAFTQPCIWFKQRFGAVRLYLMLTNVFIPVANWYSFHVNE